MAAAVASSAGSFGWVIGLGVKLKVVSRAAAREPALGVPPRSVTRFMRGLVSGKARQVQARHAAAELPHVLAQVDGAVVRDRAHLAAQVPRQVQAGRDGFEFADVVMGPLLVHVLPTLCRADLVAGNHREPVAALAGLEGRRPAAQSLGVRDGGCGHEARVVEEDDGGHQPECPLLTPGQLDRFKRAMSISVRSRARRSGCCGFPSLRCKRWLAWAQCRCAPTKRLMATAIRFVVHRPVRCGRVGAVMRSTTVLVVPTSAHVVGGAPRRGSLAAARVRPCGLMQRRLLGSNQQMR
jgi:hypothetical protein